MADHTISSIIVDYHSPTATHKCTASLQCRASVVVDWLALHLKVGSGID